MLEYTSERRCFLMAKKGQKFYKFSDELRTEIVNKYLSGKYSHALLAKEYNVSKNSISTILRKYRLTGLAVKGKKGRPKEKDISIDDLKQRYEILKKYQAFLKAQREKK